MSFHCSKQIYKIMRINKSTSGYVMKNLASTDLIYDLLISVIVCYTKWLLVKTNFAICDAYIKLPGEIDRIHFCMVVT
jgi:hypothetical protein